MSCCKIYHSRLSASCVIGLLSHVDDDLQIGVDLTRLVLQLSLLVGIQQVVI